MVVSLYKCGSLKHVYGWNGGIIHTIFTSILGGLMFDFCMGMKLRVCLLSSIHRVVISSGRNVSDTLYDI